MSRDARLTNTTGYNYNYMYPYLSNQMRTDLNPGVTTSQSTSPIDTIVKTKKMSADRRVVSRSAKKSNTAQPATTARVATSTTNVGTPTSTNRRTVARRGTTTARTATTGTSGGTRNVVARGRTTRGDNSYLTRAATNAANTPTSNSARITSARCLADYTECMNDYCLREDTAYNRCYCSSKLSQIDAVYQTSITNLIDQIFALQATNQWTDAEMNEYWMDTVGKYRGENSWTNLENALDINWAGTESRVRGQTAFNTGHEYCVQHLRGCSYMTANLRDAYRSEIARDCETYEQSLQKIKNAAESIVESYNE